MTCTSQQVRMEKAASELNSLISEYLTARGYLQTHAVLQTEAQRNSSWNPPPSQQAGPHSDFLVAFDCGERHAFFELWDLHIPATLRSGDPTCQHLEFAISVHFATYPLRKGVGDSVHSMAEFKSYLESRGAVLAQSEDFATFCALPYIPDPTRHPSFKALFTDSWPVELKARLIQFLRLTLPEANSPRLLALYLSSNSSAGGDEGTSVQALQQRLALCERQYISRLTEMQSGYHTLVGIAMELVEALEAAVAGRMITPEYIQNMCSRLFGNSVQHSSDVERPPTATSLLRTSVMSLRKSVQCPTEPFPLDYARLKADLCSASHSKKAFILQALRWRLTRSLAGEQRSAILSTFIDNDILGCAGSSPYQASVIEMLGSQDSLLREHLCRLFNTLSSVMCGRGYLSHCPAMLQAHCRVMMAEEGDTPTRRNALGAVQKLSLRRPLQLVMVEGGVLGWLLRLLADQEPLSEYTLRYTLALLMNLCLRTAGKKVCVPVGPVALKVLGELLEHEDQEICSYVNGILYSLLSLPELREEARTMGMGDMLTSAMQASPPELQSQLKYILVQLSSDAHQPSEDSGDEGEDDEEEDPDVLEGNEDEVAIDSTEPRGEALLASYERSSLQPRVAAPQAKKLLEVPYVRPVTPQTLGSRPQTANIPALPVAQGMEAAELTRRSLSTAS